MYQALVITILGMTWVFIFLLLLIYAMKFLAWTVVKFSSGTMTGEKGHSANLPRLTQAKLLAVLKARSLIP